MDQTDHPDHPERPRCPKCASIDVEVSCDEENTRAWMKGASVPQGVLLARCRACGNVHLPDPTNLWVH